MKEPLSSLEKKIRASGNVYFSSFQRPRLVSFPKKRSFWNTSWVVPSLLSTTFGVLLVTLTLQATQARGAFEDALGLTPLNTVVYPRWNDAGSEDMLGGTFLKDAISSFTSSTLPAMRSSQENVLYSPLSSYITLAMLYEASQEQTREELQSFLTIEDESLLRQEIASIFRSSYQQRYQGTNPVLQSRLANAMFIKDTYPIQASYTDLLASSYFAEVFHTSFDDRSKQDIADWINQKTNDFLSIEPEELSIQASTQWLLYNTLYMRANWLTPFEDNQTQEEIFTPDYGSALRVNMMKKTLPNARMISQETYTMITDDAFGGYQFHYVLPSMNDSVEALLSTDGFLSQLEDDQEETFVEEINVYVPQFSLINTLDLKSWMAPMIPSLFDPSLANLSNAGEGLFVQSLKQDARVDVFEQGFEAAAITEADVGTTAAPLQPTLEVRLDRSFIFLITNEQGLLHFIGIVHQPIEA